MFWLILGIWLVCGFFGYGIWKGYLRMKYSLDVQKISKEFGYDLFDELQCIFLHGIPGPFGLFFAYNEVKKVHQPIRLAYRIPKQLKREIEPAFKRRN